MSTETEDEFSEFMHQLFQMNDDHQEAIDKLHQTLSERGWLHRVRLHTYICARRGCKIATVYRAAGLTLCEVRDYKLSPGMNQARSVAEARAKNTLDGDRHWPSRVYDVEELDRFSAGTQLVGVTMNCPHYTGTQLARDILATVADVRPGKPTKPTRLGS